MRNREGLEFPEGMGALIVIDSPSIWVTDQCAAAHSNLVLNADGWTVRAAQPCVEGLAATTKGGKAMLLDALNAGAKLTINREGDLIITEAAGRVIGIGRPMPPTLPVD